MDKKSLGIGVVAALIIVAILWGLGALFGPTAPLRRPVEGQYGSPHQYQGPPPAVEGRGIAQCNEHPGDYLGSDGQCHLGQDLARYQHWKERCMEQARKRPGSHPVVVDNGPGGYNTCHIEGSLQEHGAI